MAPWKGWRMQKSEVFGAFKVAAIRDYGNRETIRFPAGDKERLGTFPGNPMFCIMNCRTESVALREAFWYRARKIKIYYGVSDTSSEGARQKLASLEGSVVGEIRNLLGI